MERDATSSGSFLCQAEKDKLVKVAAQAFPPFYLSEIALEHLVKKCFYPLVPLRESTSSLTAEDNPTSVKLFFERSDPVGLEDP